ncbi:AzlC family ABC transporter permease [Pseudoalteromonas sp. SS15]|uniref:AzlC family ABC transporter permease n=1 Tax=Pseudoalteromonas sp. SS15 TaxID=3139393 RepID=UPI003BA9EA8E
MASSKPLIEELDNTAPMQAENQQGNLSIIVRGFIDMFPLCVAVIPWGILCGSLAIQVGLSPWQAQAMSLFVFAGAAQLAGMQLIGLGSPAMPILSSTFVISSRHLLYSAVFQSYVKDLPLFKRIVFAFFLTDEMFALTNAFIAKNKRFCYVYAVASGFAFYVMWNLATLVGIVAGNNIENLQAYGLEFAIAATFIALVVPAIKDKPVLMSVLASGASVLVLELIAFEYALIASTFIGMFAGYYFAIKNSAIKREARKRAVRGEAKQEQSDE